VLGGAGHKDQFRPLTPLLGVFDVDSSVCHECDFLEMLVVMGSGQ